MKKSYILEPITLPYNQLPISEVHPTAPKKTLFVIGNGFDIMHGVPSSYWDFQKTLGKNSELRFHLETYLQAEELWSDFEDSLSHLNAGVMLDVMDMWLDNFGAYRPNSQAVDYFTAIDAAMLPIQVLTAQLPKRFRKWVDSLIMAPIIKPLEGIIAQEAKYLNFNYTDFLETVYEVPHDSIKYIHGCRKKNKGRPREKLILGHVPNVDYLKEYKPAKGMVPHYKNKRKAYLLETAMETGARQWVSYYEEVFTKHTPDIIEQNHAFFETMTDKTDIVVIGHSLSAVDYPYFKEIVRVNANKALWHIGYHSLDDVKRLMDFVREMRLEDKKITVFRT